MNRAPTVDYFNKLQQGVLAVHVPGVNRFDNGINPLLFKQWRFWRLSEMLSSMKV